MKILCVGQLVADILAAPVEYSKLDVDTQRVGKIVIKNGGDSMNTAIGLAKLGCQVGFVGKTGKDLLGGYLRSVFETHNIDIKGLQLADDLPTASVITLVNGQGQRVFLYNGGTNDTFSLTDIDFTLLEECAHVHVGGTFLLPEFDGGGCTQLLSTAKERGKTTSMDVTWDTTGRWLDVLEPCLSYLDLFMPSEAEAALITGYKQPEQMADFLLKRGVGIAVIKLGDKGAYVKGRGEGFYQSAYPVDKVVDTTGAGDSFVAGFLSRYIKGGTLRECASFAAAVAAHCILEVGTTDGIPDEAAVMRYLNM